MSSEMDTDTEGAPEAAELTDRENDIVAFSLIYTWAVMVRDKRTTFGGDMSIKKYEFEAILHKMELSNYIIDAKIKLLTGEPP